jgi:hypothetical protein
MSSIYSFQENSPSAAVVDGTEIFPVIQSGVLKQVLGVAAQDAPVTTATTASNISNSGLTLITATAAVNYTLDAPVAGRQKILTCQSTSANTVTCTTATAVTIESSMHKITFGSTDVNNCQSITLRGASALRWEVIALTGTTVATTT